MLASAQRPAPTALELPRHACLVPASPEERLDAIRAALAAALARGGRCACLLNEPAEASRAPGLTDAPAGRLVLLDAAALSSPDAALAAAERAAEGAAVLVLELPLAPTPEERLRELEAGLDALAARRDLSILCLLARASGPAPLRQRLGAHRWVAAGDRLLENPLFVPAEACAGADRAAREIDGVLDGLRREAETTRRLRAAEAQLRAMADGLSDPALLVRRDATVAWANDAVAARLGLPRERLVGRPLPEATPGPELADRLGRAFATGEPQQFTEARGGRTFEHTVSPVRGEAGRVEHVLAIARDVTEQVRALEALRESEKRYRGLVETCQEGIWSLDADRRTTFVNERAAKLVGYSPEELVGRRISEFFAPEELVDFEAQMAQRARLEATLFERRFVCRDGRVKTMLVAASPLTDAQGRYSGSVALLTDVEDLRRFEREVREREESFHQIFEHSADALYLQELDTTLVEVNSTARRQLGYAREELVGRRLAEVAALGTEPAHVARTRERLEAGELVEFESAHRRRDGSVFPVEVRLALLDYQGRRRVLASCRDITERVQAREAEERSGRQLREMLENLPLMALIVDTEGRVLFGNERLAHLLGLPRAELPGRDLSGLFLGAGPAAAEAERERLRRAVAQGEIAPAVEREHVVRGERRRVVWNNTLLRERGGAVVAVASIGQDVTEPRKLEERMRQAEKLDALGRLAGGVAHDFNNLLTVILANAEEMQLAVNAADPLFECVRDINEAAQRARDLTHQLLAFSRKQVAEPQILEVDAALLRLERMLRRLIDERVRIRLEARSRACVRMDPTHLEQVVVNLAVNARDAMPQGGDFTIASERRALAEPDCLGRPELHPGPWVALRFEDSGAGMPPEVLAHLFEPFFTTKPAGKGTGLGLATVHGIVRQAGGTVTVESRPGAGTQLTVLLPETAERPARSHPHPAAARPAPRSETVLVAEDDDSVRALVRRLLERDGYRVLIAASAESALALAEGFPAPIDLLLADVGMPGCSGLELYERLARARPDLRVLYMSGHSDEVLASVGPTEGQLLAKPFTPEALARKVRAALDRAPPARSTS